MLAALTTADLIDKVSGLLQQAFAMVGFTAPAASDMAILTVKLAADLQESYAGLTIQEISLCFEYGAKGEYGDFLGIWAVLEAARSQLKSLGNLYFSADQLETLARHRAMANLLRIHFDAWIARGNPQIE